LVPRARYRLRCFFGELEVEKRIDLREPGQSPIARIWHWIGQIRLTDGHGRAFLALDRPPRLQRERGRHATIRREVFEDLLAREPPWLARLKPLRPFLAR
jgi:hypothetical protein